VWLAQREGIPVCTPDEEILLRATARAHTIRPSLACDRWPNKRARAGARDAVVLGKLTGAGRRESRPAPGAAFCSSGIRKSRGSLPGSRVDRLCTGTHTPPRKDRTRYPLTPSRRAAARCSGRIDTAFLRAPRACIRCDRNPGAGRDLARKSSAGLRSFRSVRSTRSAADKKTTRTNSSGPPS
jgi:hypothetical protein